jgi:DNA-binding transcriptional LysR family regulator
MPSRSEPSIELRALRYLVAASEHGSFRKAALALDIQESSISRRIRDLEDEIGATLFLRHTGGVSLTLAGQRYLVHARRAISHLYEGQMEAAAIGRAEDGHLKIGVFSHLASGFLSDLFAAYDARHSGVHVDFVDASPDDQVTAIRHLELDGAFVLGQPEWPECEVLPLWTEAIFCALPEGHRLAAKTEIAWSDLTEETILNRSEGSGAEVRSLLEWRFARFDAVPQIETQRVARSNLVGLVATGRGVVPIVESETVVPFPGVIYRPVAEARIPYSLVYSPQNGNPAFRSLLSLARSMATVSAAELSGQTDGSLPVAP